MTYVPLTQASVLSTLNLTPNQFSHLQLLAPPPIAPDQITSATLTEYFVMTPDSVFSDSAGSFTTPATIGGTVGSVKARNSRTETLIQTTSANQPTYAREVNSGTLSLLGNGSSTIMMRSYTGPVLSGLAVYSIAPSGNSRNYQVVAITLGATSGSAACEFYGLRTPSSGTPYYLDSCRYRVDSADGSTAFTVDPTPYVGDPDVVMFRSTGGSTPILEIDRAGQSVCTPVTCTQAGIAPLGTAGSAALMAGLSAANTGTSYLKGNLIAWVSFSTRVSDAEMPGLMAWARSLVPLKVPSGRYLGLYFYGDGSTENGTSKSLAMVRSDDLINWNHVPVAIGPDSNYQYPRRDPGVGYDPVTSTIYCIPTYGTLSTTYIFGSSDYFHFTTKGSYSTASLVSGSSSQIWAPEFVKNQDGSMWKDAAGLPRLIFAYSSTGNFDFNLATIKPVDTTWGSGGSWNNPVPITWATAPADIIDASVIMTTDGTFHLTGATRTASGPGNSTIRHATASSIDGTWTINSASDVFGLGSTWESPQWNYRASDGVWVLHLDKQGLGYYYSISTTGVAGTYSTPKPINCSFIPQHGNMIPAPIGA